MVHRDGATRCRGHFEGASPRVDYRRRHWRSVHAFIHSFTDLDVRYQCLNRPRNSSSSSLLRPQRFPQLISKIEEKIAKISPNFHSCQEGTSHYAYHQLKCIQLYDLLCFLHLLEAENRLTNISASFL